MNGAVYARYPMGGIPPAVYAQLPCVPSKCRGKERESIVLSGMIHNIDRPSTERRASPTEKHAFDALAAPSVTDLQRWRVPGVFRGKSYTTGFYGTARRCELCVTPCRPAKSHPFSTCYTDISAQVLGDCLSKGDPDLRRCARAKLDRHGFPKGIKQPVPKWSLTSARYGVREFGKSGDALGTSAPRRVSDRKYGNCRFMTAQSNRGLQMTSSKGFKYCEIRDGYVGAKVPDPIANPLKGTIKWSVSCRLSKYFNCREGKVGGKMACIAQKTSKCLRVCVPKNIDPKDPAGGAPGWRSCKNGLNSTGHGRCLPNLENGPWKMCRADCKIGGLDGQYFCGMLTHGL